jgi:hypothetical protein
LHLIVLGINGNHGAAIKNRIGIAFGKNKSALGYERKYEELRCDFHDDSLELNRLILDLEK